MMGANDQISSIFSDALMEVIVTSTGVSLDVITRESDNSFEHMTGVMNLCGKKSGMLFITAKEHDIRVLCARMIGATPAEVTEDEVEDALGEFVNMTAGNAKLRLSDTDFLFTLSPPFILKGGKTSIIVKRRTHISSIVLGNGDISLNIKILY